MAEAGADMMDAGIGGRGRAGMAGAVGVGGTDVG
jgi:hypothetical protein